MIDEEEGSDLQNAKVDLGIKRYFECDVEYNKNKKLLSEVLE